MGSDNPLIVCLTIDYQANLPDKLNMRSIFKHYSTHTERAYWDWIKQFVKFHHLTDRQAVVRQRFADYRSRTAQGAGCRF